MSAKEALLQRVTRLSEDEAAEWLDRLESELGEEDELTPEELAAVEADEADVRAGNWVDGEELFRRHGL